MLFHYYSALLVSCADHGSAAAIMLSVGFSPELEPHLRGILTYVCAVHLWELREKARIFVSSGRWLMGILDEVVKGFVVITKNPCLHPGDVRILEAVDAPALHHLHDCLVFLHNGDRPHTNEAFISDLDGDLYFVTWDENLIPPSKRSWTPMEYIS